MKKIMNFKKSVSLIKGNLRAIIGFEVLYRIIMSLIVVPIGRSLIGLSFKIAGIDYLGNDTLKTFFLNPIIIIGIIIVLIALSFIIMFEIAGVIFAINMSKNGIKTSARAMFYQGFLGAKNMIFPRNYMGILMMVVIMPLAGTATFSSYVGTFEIPGFINDFINAKIPLLILVTIVFLLLGIFILRRMFAFNYYCEEKEVFGKSMRSSKELTKGRTVRTLLSFIYNEIIFLLIFAIVYIVSVLIMILCMYIFVKQANRYTEAIEMAYIIFKIIRSIYSFIVIPFSIALTSNLFYTYKKESNKQLVNYENYTKKVPMVVWPIGIILGFFITFTSFFTRVSSLSASTITDYIKNYFTMGKKVTIAAHRGYSSVCPENSMPAFKKAIEKKLEWIELDVHQTKDGKVVVTHDADINRIAGVDKNVYDLTYDELESYDVGSWFSPKFKGLKVSTLDEVIKVCKDKIKIQIEIKPTGHEKNFVQNVVDIVKKNGFEDQCMLASLNADALKEVKKIDKNLKTLYIMYIAVGDFENADFADAYSVEENSATLSLTTDLHNMNKECCAWTINNAESVERLMDNQVDFIVTDDPPMIAKEIEEYRNGGVFREFVELFFKPEK